MIINNNNKGGNTMKLIFRTTDVLIRYKAENIIIKKSDPGLWYKIRQYMQDFLNG